MLKNLLETGQIHQADNISFLSSTKAADVGGGDDDDDGGLR